MGSYGDFASVAAFLAGREAARAMRADGVQATADDAETGCARGMHPGDTEAWRRGVAVGVGVSYDAFTAGYLAVGEHRTIATGAAPVERRRSVATRRAG